MFHFEFGTTRYHHIHFIGIGGISMSGLAALMLSKGYTISGSDMKTSPITDHLQDLGITVFEGHDPSQIEGADLIVYTDAIHMDNPEYRAAVQQKIDVVDRATFLGAVMKNFHVSIAVSGTHGKTTTTSMIATAIKDEPFSPTIMVGGNLGEISGNVRIGTGDFFLTEACEYRANVLKYFPSTAIILNIDEDHLDFFDNIDHILDTFRQYAGNLTEDDLLILNKDDANAYSMKDATDARLITVGIESDADYEARHVHVDPVTGHPDYDLYIHGEKIATIRMRVMGLHNVTNSLAAIAACAENGIDIDKAIAGVQSYHGVGRRLEYKGEVDGIRVIDDYAHHPTEIASTLHALKPTVENRLICIFQPHTYTRTKLLLDSFSHSFKEADVTIIADIYAAREKDYGDIHSKTLVEAVRANHDQAIYIGEQDDILDYIREKSRPGDVILTMGAGDIFRVGERFLESSSEATK
ncbi:MAG: UDP-N-acetylmuramate--L-alanine ligase [Peptoniphilus sp.]|nr:UDP-N-acetylmuramate--L-alanine ligase [Peptoniphilus sp.]MDD7362542.1 UDP-N-acetylmuramate--L-alanine ligase [Bacillota bacterium]MDY6045059.1 UDP-N-acetylmuramate--L-alanine ligase [Peptoniphilus sp.]